jgi:hypothetical protein
MIGLITIVFLLILLMMLSSSCNYRLRGSAHSNEFRMIPTDEAETAYKPVVENEQIVFRPIEFSAETTAPDRVYRRTSTPIDRRSNPVARPY